MSIVVAGVAGAAAIERLFPSVTDVPPPSASTSVFSRSQLVHRLQSAFCVLWRSARLRLKFVVDAATDRFGRAVHVSRWRRSGRGKYDKRPSFVADLNCVCGRYFHRLGLAANYARAAQVARAFVFLQLACAPIYFLSIQIGSIFFALNIPDKFARAAARGLNVHHLKF